MRTTRKHESEFQLFGALQMSPTVQSTWIFVNYLTVVGLATAGWLYFLVWIAMQLIF